MMRLHHDSILKHLFTAMQIQYNITRIEEWCKSHDMPEGTLQLEHLMQATKLLQLKKVCYASMSLKFRLHMLTLLHSPHPQTWKLSTMFAGC